MNEEGTSKNLLLDSTVNEHRRAQCSIAAKKLLQKWESGINEDLPSALSNNPELSEDRSLFLDLVQSEYRNRKVVSSQQSPDIFCKRFNGLISDELLESVHRLIEVEHYLSECPDLLELINNFSWPAEGEKFDEFILIAEIGRGASSRVFLAEQPSLGKRLVALKVMPVTVDEVDIVANLLHENVVTIHSTGQEESSGLNWICMPFLGRRTMRQAIKDKFCIERLEASSDNQIGSISNKNQNLLHEEHVIWLAIKIAKGIAYIQNQGIFHGDLKPSNILLTDKGIPVLIDFNLSQSTNIETRRVGGTLPYMAPEHLQLLSKSKFVDCLNTTQSEVFAYGVILFEMLTSEHPYFKQDNSTDYQESAEKILRTKESCDKGYDDRLKGYDPRLRKLIKKCLSNKAEDRPSNFEEIVKSLQGMQSKVSRATRLIRRRPKFVLAATVSFLFLIYLLAVYIPIAFDHVTVKRAEWMISSGDNGRSISLLTPYVENHSSDLRSTRLLAYSHLRENNFEAAKGRFNNAWRLSNDPLDAAMVGYCFNLCDGPDASELFYRMANSVNGFFNVAVNHNYARRHFSVIIKGGYDRERSLEIERLLVEAHKAAPNNQKIKMLMMNHVTLNFDQNQPLPTSYSVSMVLFDVEKACRSCCYRTLRFLDIMPLEDSYRVEIGFPYVRQLVAYMGLEEAAEAYMSRLFNTYKKHESFSELDQTPRKISPDAPKSYMNPLDWCSSEVRSKYLSGDIWHL